MNPITRRPGPGRGRPRKQPPLTVPGAPGTPIGLAPIHMSAPGMAPGTGPEHSPPGIPGIDAEPMAHSFVGQSQSSELPQPVPHLHPLQHAQQQPPQIQEKHPQQYPQPLPQQLPPQPPQQSEKEDVPTSDQPVPPTDQSPPPRSKPEDPVPSEPETPQPEPEVDEDDDTDEPDAKRRRVEMSDPDTAKEVMDDEAVLALAAHNGSVDSFPSP